MEIEPTSYPGTGASPDVWQARAAGGVALLAASVERLVHFGQRLERRLRVGAVLAVMMCLSWPIALWLLSPPMGVTISLVLLWAVAVTVGYLGVRGLRASLVAMATGLQRLHLVLTSTEYRSSTLTTTLEALNTQLHGGRSSLFALAKQYRTIRGTASTLTELQAVNGGSYTFGLLSLLGLFALAGLGWFLVLVGVVVRLFS